MIVGIGVDIVQIQRVRHALENQSERFIRRVCTAAEHEFCRSRRDPVPHYAARFAAKESLFKALGTGWAKGMSWRDVEVQRKDEEAPTLVLRGEAEKRSRELGITTVHLTLSHSEDSALAVVILER